MDQEDLGYLLTYGIMPQDRPAVFRPKDVSPVAVHHFPESQDAGMYTRSELSSFWDGILISACLRIALKVVQNLTSRIRKLEKLFTDEIATYTSITVGIHSQYFLLYDKLRQLEPGNSDVIIWKIPSVKFVFDSAKVARPSSDPLIEPATSFSSPIFRTHPHGYNFFIKFYP